VNGHVLLARLDNAGDVLLTGPAVRAVAADSARVTFMCGTAGFEAAQLLPGIDEIVVFDAPWVAYESPVVDRAEFEAVIDRLSALQIDEAIIFTSFHQSPLPLALMLRLAGIPLIAATSADFPGSLLDVRHHVIDGHEVEQSLDLVMALGHHLPAGDDGRLQIRQAATSETPFAEPYVVVHPGASVPARAIPIDVAAEAVSLLADVGWHVAVTGGDDEKALTAFVSSDHPHVADLGGQHDFAGLAATIAGASAVVAGNTGPAHLAAAVGTPVVSVFAPVVSARRWAPWRVPTVLLGDQSVPCRHCRSRVCPIAGQPCLRPVTPAAIVAGVETLVFDDMAVGR
jgi:ADP-heptose:LPS heptosyltransferase